MLGLIFLSGFWSCGIGNASPNAKIGHCLDKIKKIDYQFSLKKLNAKDAAEKIMPHVNAIRALNNKIPQDDPIKEFLISFVSTWDTAEKIRESLSDGHVKFMTDVTTFYMRDFVKAKKGWKTLFPIFKP